jgi:hypothetical protein
MLKTLVSLALLAGPVLAQGNGTVALSYGNPDAAFTTLFFYDGMDHLEYKCIAPAFRNPAAYVWAITPTAGQGTLTSIVDSSNTATVTTAANHGLSPGNRVVVAGVTGDTDLNGTYVVQTVGSATTFTITTASVTDGSYTNSGITVSSTAPRTSAPMWSIIKFTYDGDLLEMQQFAVGTGNNGIATTSYSFICDNRAVTTGSTAISYQ